MNSEYLVFQTHWLLFMLDLVTGAWFYKLFLFAYYASMFFVVRRIWRRALGETGRPLLLLLCAFLIAPTAAGEDVVLLMPFPLGILGLTLLTIDFPQRAAIMFLWNLIPFMLLWGLFCGIYYYVRKSSGRAASARPQ